jgi:tetratricopeptide (TPR) repeat protein
MKRWSVARLAGIATLALSPSSLQAQAPNWNELDQAGAVLHQSGRYAEAEKKHRQALELAEQFGSKDPRLANSLNNLAMDCEAQGKYSEAEPLNRQAIAILENMVPPNEPALAMAFYNLARLRADLGNYAEARSASSSAQLRSWRRA